MKGKTSGQYRLVPDILRAMAEKHPDHRALSVDRHESITFKTWEERSNRLGRAFFQKGAKKKTAGLFFNNHNACLHYIAYFAAQKAGMIPFPINTRMGDEEIAHLLRHAEPALLAVEEESVDRIKKLQKETGYPEQILPESILRSLAESGDKSPYQEAYDEEDPCDIIYTSGTTGVPKGVVTTHANINYWDDEKMGELFPSMPGAETLNAIPIFTFAGVHGMMLFNLRNALSHNILPKFEARRFLEVIEEKRILISYIVPAMAELIVKEKPPLPDLSSVKLLTFGTAPMKPETILKLRHLFPQAILCNLYGLTEGGTATCACFFYPGEPEEIVAKKLKSVGQPVPPTKVLILNEKGEPCPPGEIGEIVFEHPSRPRKYFKNDAMTEKLWKEKGKNRLFTGDLGYVDPEGNLYITDRQKDMIIRGGFNIFPSEVEEVIRQHPAVEDAAVVGVKHDVLGEDVKAYVILKPGTKLTLEELQAFLKPKLTDYKIPRQMAVVDDFPRNAIGKVLKTELAKNA